LAAKTNPIVWLTALASIRRAPHGSAAALLPRFLFVALTPTSNVIVFIGSVMAETFLYLPSVGQERR